MDTLRPKVAVNVFVIKNDQVLLGKRKNAAGEGDWGLPGGHVEWMERLTVAAKRELEEETGLKAKKLSFLHAVNDPNAEDNSHYLHVCFVADEYEGEPKLMEPHKCHEWKWFSLDMLPKNIFIGHRKLFEYFKQGGVFFD